MDIGDVCFRSIQAQPPGKKKLLQDFPRPFCFFVRPGCDNDVVGVSEDIPVRVVNFTIPVWEESLSDFCLETVQDHIPKNRGETGTQRDATVCWEKFLTADQACPQTLPQDMRVHWDMLYEPFLAHAVIARPHISPENPLWWVWAA